MHSSDHPPHHSFYTPFPIKKIISHIKHESLSLSLSLPIPTLSFISLYNPSQNTNTPHFHFSISILLFALLPFLLLLITQKLISLLQKHHPASHTLFFLHSALSLFAITLTLALTFSSSKNLPLILLHLTITSASLTSSSLKIIAFLKLKNLSLFSYTPSKTQKSNPTLHKTLIHSLLQYPTLYSALAFHILLLSLSLISSSQIDPNPFKLLSNPKTPQPHHSILISLHNPKLQSNPSPSSFKNTKLFLQALNSNIQNLPSISSSFSQYPIPFLQNYPSLSFKNSSLSSFYRQLNKFYHSLLFQNLKLSLNLSQFKPPIPPIPTLNPPFIPPQNFTPDGFFINNEKSSFLIFAQPHNPKINLPSSQTLFQDLQLAFSKTQKQFPSQPHTPFLISSFSPHFQLLQNLQSSIHDFWLFSSISLTGLLLLTLLHSRSLLPFLLLIFPLLFGTILTYAFTSLFFPKITLLTFSLPFLIIPFILPPAFHILPQFYQNPPTPLPLLQFLKSSKPLLSLSLSSSILSLLPSLSHIPDLIQFSILSSIAFLILPASFLVLSPLTLILASKLKTWINQSAPYPTLKIIKSSLKTPYPYPKPSYIYSQPPLQSFFHSLSKNHTPILIITSLLTLSSFFLIPPLTPPNSFHSFQSSLSPLSFKTPQNTLNNTHIPSQFQIQTSPTILTTSHSKQTHILQSLNHSLKQPSPPFHSFHSLSSYSPKPQILLKIQKLIQQISKLPHPQNTSQTLKPLLLWQKNLKKNLKKTPKITPPPKPIPQLFKNHPENLSIYIFPHQNTLSNPQKLLQFSQYIQKLIQIHHIPQSHVKSPHLLIHKLLSQSKNHQTLILLLSILSFAFLLLFSFKNTQHSLILSITTLSSLSFLIIFLFAFNIPLNHLNLLFFPLILASSSSFPFLAFHHYLSKQPQPLLLIFKNITPNLFFSFLLLSLPLLPLSSSYHPLISSLSILLILSFTSSFLSSILILYPILASQFLASSKTLKSKTLS